jgi:tetratricopeptide (TPR) repeat protein
VLGNKVWILLVVAVASFSWVSDSFATDILVEFDKSEYDTGDELTLTGFIPEFTMPIVAVSIYDPNGTILSANNLEIDEDGLFSKTFSLDSPFFDVPGKYTVKIDYKKTSQEEFFVISGQETSNDATLEDVIEPEIILLTTEKEVYTDGDTVKITGIVSALDSPTVLIGIYDPFGTPAGFYFGTIDDNLEFSTSFLVKAGVNFKIDGIYSIKAHYAEKEISTNFEFYENKPKPIDDKPKPIDDKPKPIDDKPKPIDDKPKPIDDKPKPIDDKPKPIADDKEKKNSNKDNNSVIQTEPKEKQKKNESNSVIKETIQSKENTSTPKEPEPKSDNLSVEDVELGKLLNQINLNCDRSKYADTISYYDGMGPALYRLCKFDSSIEVFSESLSKDPNNVEILTNKGSALGKLGYHNEAILHYDRALSIDPNFFPALNNKANSFAVMGDYEEAITLYSKALAKNPNYFTARQNLELVLSELPQDNFQPINQQNPKNIPQTNQQDSSDDTKLTPSSNEKSENLFEQLGSMFSSLGSLLGISN